MNSKKINNNLICILLMCKVRSNVIRSIIITQFKIEKNNAFVIVLLREIYMSGDRQKSFIPCLFFLCREVHLFWI